MYRLPENLRAIFQAPFGPVMQTPELLDSLTDGQRVVCVGDVVTQTLLDAGHAPHVAIVDGRTQRGPLDSSARAAIDAWPARVMTVSNPAATVTEELVAAIQESVAHDEPTRIQVEGEEDLAGLPVFAHAPDGTIVLYGMPNRGVVRAVVDARLRTKARDLLERMRTE